MKKDFQDWHNRKSTIDAIEKRPFFHEREIWFCYLGVNVGFEQDGIGRDFLRPVIIFRKFNNEIFWAVPLTKSDGKNIKKSKKFYYSFSFISGVTSIAILSQIRLIDARRLSRHIGSIADNDFDELKKKLKALFP
jgi:mRNA interferase MazF